jgi:hypothetical protein
MRFSQPARIMAVAIDKTAEQEQRKKTWLEEARLASAHELGMCLR